MKRFFTLICLGLCFITVHAQNLAHLGYSFEQNDTNCKKVITIDTNTYKNNKWQVGHTNKWIIDSNYYGDNVMITDTLNSYPALDTSVFTLKIRAITFLPGFGYSYIYNIGFQYQLDKNPGSIAKLELSIDSGHHWVADIFDTTTGWTSFQSSLVANDPFINSFRYLIPNMDSVYRQNDSALLRFTLISDSSTLSRAGWMIDNINIEYYVEGVQQVANNNIIKVYPNPSSGTFYFYCTKVNPLKASVVVYDMSGKPVYCNNEIASKTRIELPLPNGIYLLKYSDAEEYAEQRIVISR